MSVRQERVTLGIIILCAGQTVLSSVNQGKDGLIWSSFEPEEHKLYEVFVTYNKEPIPGVFNLVL